MCVCVCVCDYTHTHTYMFFFPFLKSLYFFCFIFFLLWKSRYLGDKVLVAGVVGGDDGEDVPVVLLHDVEDDRRLLLDGGAELKEHGVVVLETHTETHTHTVTQQHWSECFFFSHSGERIPLKERRQPRRQAAL